MPHVLRHDLWVSCAERLAAILFWPHPGVHWLNRELAQSREEVCDNFVLRRSSPASYAQTLLSLAEQYTAAAAMYQPLGVLSPRWTLEQRIAGLLDPRRNTNTRCGILTVVALLALTGTASLLVGGVQGGPAESAEAPAIEDVKPPLDASPKSRSSTPDSPPEPFPADKVLGRVGDQVIRTRDTWLQLHVLRHFARQDLDEQSPQELQRIRETIERQLHPRCTRGRGADHPDQVALSGLSA